MLCAAVKERDGPAACWATCCLGRRQNELHWETVVKGAASQSLINTSSLVAQVPYRSFAVGVHRPSRLPHPRPAWVCEAQALPDVLDRLQLRASGLELRPSRVPMQPIAASPAATLHYRDWHWQAPLLAGGGPAYPGRPSAVSNWQGMPQRIAYLSLHAYYFITTRDVAAGELQFGQGQRSVASPTRVWQVPKLPLPETSFDAVLTR